MTFNMIAVPGATHRDDIWFYKCKDGEWFRWWNAAWERCPAPFAVTAVEPTAWNGEGLPPEGSTVLADQGSEQLKVKVLFHGVYDGRPVAVCQSDAPGVFVCDAPVLHPIPTVRETAIAAMREIENRDDGGCTALYDEGYRKVPNLHLLATRLSGVAGVGHADRDRLEKVLLEVLG